MTVLQERLLKASTLLGLSIDLDFTLTLPSGREVSALARISGLGAAQGMLIAPSFESFRTASDELVAAGFGYSVLSEPKSLEGFNIESFIEMFSDWGWAGDNASRPSWLRCSS